MRLALLIAIAAVCHTSTASAQFNQKFWGRNGYYQPLHARMPAGKAARWTTAKGRGLPPILQPTQVLLPGGGDVGIFQAGQAQPLSMPSGGLVGLHVGHVYRLKLSNMPAFPGVELYPTVEVLDRLHPPEGKSLEFPVPIQLTEKEIQSVVAGGMLRKVIYLEQPQLASPRPEPDVLPTMKRPTATNILAEADMFGRTLAIVRIGTRVPSPITGAAFYGTGGFAKVFEKPKK